MAVRTKSSTTLKITRVTATTETGKETHDYVNLAVNPDLSDDDLLSIGNKLCYLQKFTISSIGRIDTSALEEA